MSNEVNSNLTLPALVIDFEATDASIDAQATEMGFCAVAFYANGALNPLSQPDLIRCKPDRDISYGSMAVTGICPEDIAGEPSHKIVVAQNMPIGPAYIIGHNVDYDLQVASNAGVDTSHYKAICTLAIARALHPDIEHSLTALLYRFDYEEARRYAQNAHSANFDVRFCIRLLRVFCADLGIKDMETLYQFSEQARIPKTMPIGKFKGFVIADLKETLEQRDYLFWAICNLSDQYLVAACIKTAEWGSVTCIKPNGIFEKDKVYMIDHFISNRALIILNDKTEYVATVDMVNNKVMITVSSADKNIDDALFKVA